MQINSFYCKPINNYILNILSSSKDLGIVGGHSGELGRGEEERENLELTSLLFKASAPSELLGNLGP